MSSITSNYTVRSNVEKIEDAQLIFLGETHYNNEHRRNNAKIIDSLYKPGEIVFVEAEENISTESYKSQFNSQIKFVTSPIIIKGWDIDFNLKDIFYEGVEIIKNNAKLMPLPFILPMIVHQVAGEAFHLDKLALIAGLSITLFVCIAESSKKSLEKLPLRNRHMFMILDKHSPLPGNRKYVIGGSFHFSEVDEIQKKNGLLNDQAMKEFTEYLKDKKFAILIPK